MASSNYNQAESSKEMYNARASEYEKSWHPEFASDFLDQLDPPISPGQTVLDLACGTGLVTFLAAARVGRNGKVIGVDVSDGMLEQANRRKEAGYNSHVQLFQHDITNLDDLLEATKVKGEGGFDLITCASALVLLENPSGAIKHWASFLKPGGRLIVDVPHPYDQVAGRVIEVVGRRLDVRVPYNRSWVEGPGSLRHLLSEAGLDVQEMILVHYGNPKGAWYDIWFDDIDAHFHKVNPIAWKETLKSKGLLDKALELFREEWKALARGMAINETNGVFVAVAIAPPAFQKNFPPLPRADRMEEQDEEPLFTGGCMCSPNSNTSVKYAIYAKPEHNLTYCHCSTCRRLSGSAFLPFMDIPISGIHFTSTTSLKTRSFSPHAERGFCSNCGAHIYMRYRKDAEWISITMGSVDEESLPESGEKGFWEELGLPWNHIYLKENADWYKVGEDGFGHFEGFSDGFEFE